MTPRIGRIVHYKLSAIDAEKINLQVREGNTVREGEVFPMIITKLWGSDPDSYLNGQLFLDGSELYWVTSTKVGDTPGTYAWPLY